MIWLISASYSTSKRTDFWYFSCLIWHLSCSSRHAFKEASIPNLSLPGGHHQVSGSWNQTFLQGALNKRLNAAVYCRYVFQISAATLDRKMKIWRWPQYGDLIHSGVCARLCASYLCGLGGREGFMELRGFIRWTGGSLRRPPLSSRGGPERDKDVHIKRRLLRAHLLRGNNLSSL